MIVHTETSRQVNQPHNEAQFIQLLEQSQLGDEAAWSSLVKLIYADLRKLARAHIGPRPKDITMNSTALVNECYLRLTGSARSHVNSRAHFMNLASKVMRQVLCDYARASLSEKRGGRQKQEQLDAIDQEISREATQLIQLDDLLRKLEVTNPHAARTFECRFFAGLSENETSEALGRSIRSVQRDWQEARNWLSSQLD